MSGAPAIAILLEFEAEPRIIAPPMSEEDEDRLLTWIVSTPWAGLLYRAMQYEREERS